MCGIAGFELSEADESTAAVLRERLASRGPDGGWFAKLPPYGFVQTRLSVIDLSERVQYPLRNESGDLHLLFNGEVYDYQRERAELERRGHRFSTECDAEVVLHGYEEWGMAVFRRLDAMFALAMFHAPSRELLLVRDALGIKPLVHTTGARFAFASDAISLVAAGLSHGEIDRELLGDYLAYHYIPSPATGLQDVEQLGPGEALRRSARGELNVERWRSQPFTVPRAMTSIAVDEATAILDRSVRRQLVADVPVGVFLSSGVDSSLVLDSAVRSGAQPTAFTIGFPAHGGYDEARAAGRLAQELGVPHVVDELSTGFADCIAGISSAYDQPIADASAIATLHLARLARGRVTVGLSGTGGDDLFAGYYRHRAHLFSRLLGWVPDRVTRRLASLPREYGNERQSAISLGRWYMTRLAAVRGSDGFSQYLELVGSASSPRAAELVSVSPVRSARLRAVAQRVDPSSSADRTLLRTIQAFELATYLAGDLLVKEDRATMAVGLEARVPLLGAELVDLAERTPDAQKISLLSGKRLLREIGRRRLPSYVTRARKRGFAVPLADLFRGPWKAEAAEWLADSSSALVDTRAAASMLAQGSLPATDAWAVAVLVGWESSVRQATQRATLARV
jgi:asparagine synthase (glutamine-hydrolysing)